MVERHGFTSCDAAKPSSGCGIAPSNRIEAGIVLQEVLSRLGECDKALNEQEYWTLEVLDFTESWRPGFVVQQSCGRWSEIDRQFMFEELETEQWPLLIDAEERYEARRTALMKNGFVHSDMDF